MYMGPIEPVHGIENLLPAPKFNAFPTTRREPPDNVALGWIGAGIILKKS